MNERKFHFSIDDVLPSLIEVADNNLSLKDHPLYRDLWMLFEQYGVKTGLYVFNSTWLGGKKRFLSEIHNLQNELEDGWLFFGPHAVNYETAPYDQNINENIDGFKAIYTELDRIAGPYLCQSVRLHYHSECFELVDFFNEWGVKELLTTDKPIGLHRFADHLKAEMLQKGTVPCNGLNLRRSHIRIENLANDSFGHDDFVSLAEQILSMHEKLVVYSHEYEHKRQDVVNYLHQTMTWIHEDLSLLSDQP